MSALNVGFAQVSVVPSFAGFQKAITKETGAIFPAEGKKAGGTYGKAIAQGFTDSSSDLKKAAQDLEKKVFSAQDALKKSKAANKTATDAETKASGELRVAELKLAEAREKGNGKASALAKAENDLAEKQRKSADASGKAVAAHLDLQRSSESLESAEKELKTATDKANQELAQTPAEAAKAKKGLKGLRDQADDTKKGMGKLGDYLKGAFAGAIAVVSFNAIVSGLSETIQLAGDLEQSLGAVDSVFKDQAGKVHAKASTASSDVGVSKNQYNELSSLMGAQLKNAGTPMDALAEKTSGLITLGADLSSMFGGSTKEAIEALSSALKGEMDPIERYGISLSQASLEAEALSKGIIKPTKDAVLIEEAATKMTLAQTKYNEAIKKNGKDSDEAKRAKLGLTSAERAFNKASAGKLPQLEAEAKSLAIQSALYSQSADAQGNFSRESGTLQGQQQRLNAEITDLKTSLGTAFLPMMASVVSAIRTTVIPALKEFGGWIKDNQAWLKPLAIALGSVLGAFLLFKGVTTAIFAVNGAITLLKGGFVALNTTMKANVFILIASAIAGLVAGFIYLWQTNENFRNFFIQAWENIKTVAVAVFTAIKDAVMGAWTGFIKPAFDAMVSVVRDKVAPAFVWFYQSVILPVWTAIKTAIAIVVALVIAYVKLWVWVFKNVLAPAMLWVWNSVLKPTFSAIGSFFKWVWENVLRPAFNAVKTAFQAVGTFLTWVWTSILKPTFNALGSFFRWVWENVLRPAFDAVKRGFNTLVQGLKYYWDFILKPVFRALGDFFKWVWTAILKPAFDSVKNGFGGLVNGIRDFWNNKLKPIFQALGNFVRDTVAPVFQKGVDKIKGIWESIQDFAKKPIKFVIDTVINRGLIGSFNKVAEWLKIDKIGEVSVPGFARGGWTGPGAKYDEAGIVHADEFVVQKSSRRGIERKAPGFLDSLNRLGAKALGYANGGLVKPVRGGSVTSRFGASRGAYPHAGIDFAVPTGTPVFAAMDGTVQQAKTNAIAGRTGIGAFLGHEGNRNTYYGHLSRLMVQVGDMVRKGQQIALSGNTGNSTGPHLHFETWTGGKPVNPEAYLNGAELPSGGVGGGFNPLQGLLDVGSKINGWFTNSFPGGGAFVDMARAGGLKTFETMKDWGAAKLAAIGDVGQDIWGNVKDVFNGKDSGVQAAVRGVANQYGWGSGRHWDSLSKLINKESSWDPNAANPSSSARGLFQKMISIHGALESTPEGQARWGLNYIKGRYGDPEKAWAFHKRNNSYADGGQVKPTLYDNGGWLTTGLSQVQNLTRKPEPILTSGQWDSISKLALSKTVGGYEINVSVPNPGATGNDIADAIYHNARVHSRGGR